MNSKDLKLGMNRPIFRRDFLHGFGVLTAGALATGALSSTRVLAEQILAAQEHSDTESGQYYPPALTGMRGNHSGSFEVAHKLGREGRADWGPIQKLDSMIYDLVVVGGGISGLSAAHFYRKENPKANILILENHDDFGGHAKRNEFQVGEHNLISYGGSSYLVAPASYSQIVKGLLKDIGVDLKRLETSFDKGFYKRHGLRAGLHFNKENWGVDRTVPFADTFFTSFPFAETLLTLEESVAQMPISDAAKVQFLRLLTLKEDQLTEFKGDAKVEYLSSISYRDFLSKHLGITEPDVFAVLQDLAVDPGMGIEAVDAYSALDYSRLPGWDAAGLPNDKKEHKFAIHRFPDGNASIARLLVRLMIPNAAPGNTMEDIVTARFDYSKLDQDSSTVRLRLNSTVVKVENNSDKKMANTVRIDYVSEGQTYQIHAKGCVLACNNSAIPYLCPELPEPQKEALANQVKQPIIMTRVAFRNWKALKKVGIGRVYSPGSYYIGMFIDYPVSMGDYVFSGGPDEPVVVDLYRYPHFNNQGLTPKEQYRQARHELLTTSYETIERKTREQLTSLFAEGGFDPAEDIAGITVNRWAHGYAYDMWSHLLFDQFYDDDNDERYPHIRARKPFGRITIANADSAATAMLEAAVEQGHRAVTELL